MNFDIEDMRYFADKHRGKHKTSGAHWSTIIRFPVLFDEYEKLVKRNAEEQYHLNSRAIIAEEELKTCKAELLAWKYDACNLAFLAQIECDEDAEDMNYHKELVEKYLSGEEKSENTLPEL